MKVFIYDMDWDGIIIVHASSREEAWEICVNQPNPHDYFLPSPDDFEEMDGNFRRIEAKEFIE